MRRALIAATLLISGCGFGAQSQGAGINHLHHNTSEREHGTGGSWHEMNGLIMHGNRPLKLSAISIRAEHLH